MGSRLPPPRSCGTAAGWWREARAPGPIDLWRGVHVAKHKPQVEPVSCSGAVRALRRVRVGADGGEADSGRIWADISASRGIGDSRPPPAPPAPTGAPLDLARTRGPALITSPRQALEAGGERPRGAPRRRDLAAPPRPGSATPLGGTGSDRRRHHPAPPAPRRVRLLRVTVSRDPLELGAYPAGGRVLDPPAASGRLHPYPPVEAGYVYLSRCR